MPDPREHAEHRGAIESVLRYLPGFRGYLEKEYRRESDELQRAWLADRLQRSKRGLDNYVLALTDAGRVDELPQYERVRSRLDRVISRIRGAVQGYSGFFDFVQVHEDLLDDVYEHDAAMLRDVEALAARIEQLGGQPAEGGSVAPELLGKIDAVEQQVDQREDLLKGLGPGSGS